MDLKLCSDVPIVNFVDTWTFVTVFTSRHLGRNIWVLANGSKMICQPLEHLLGPGSSHMGLGIWVFQMSDLIFMCLVLLDLEPKTQDPNPKTQIVGPRTRQMYMLPYEMNLIGLLFWFISREGSTIWLNLVGLLWFTYRLLTDY